VQALNQELVLLLPMVWFPKMYTKRMAVVQ